MLDRNVLSHHHIILTQPSHVSQYLIPKNVTELLPTNTQISRKVLSNRQILKVFVIIDDQALLVCQMQDADEAVRGRNIGHGLFGVDCLQAVDDICKGERAIDSFGCRIVGRVRRWWCLDLI